MRAHQLVFLVGQRQRRGHGDGIARVHAHGVHVLDGADDDGIVGTVAHDLHLEFLPAQQALVDQDLPDRRGVHAGAAIVDVVLAVVGHAAAGAAQRVGGADDGRQADLFQRFQRDGHAGVEVVVAVRAARGGDDGGPRVLDAQPVHRLAEQVAVLGHLDGLAPGADHLDAVILQNTHVGQRQRGVQPGLPAHGGQQRVGAFLGDDLGHRLGGQRLDVGCIGQAGVGHDRGRVRVDQDHPVAFFAQRLAGLRAGIVEFAGLADDDGPRTDDHDRLDVGSLRHSGGPSDVSCAARARRAVPKPSRVIGMVHAGARAHWRRPRPARGRAIAPGGVFAARGGVFGPVRGARPGLGRGIGTGPERGRRCG